MSTISKPQKYLNILVAGRRLFWKHGFRRVTVEEICKEAGVSKMTFYRFFPNKLELAKTVIDKVFADSLNGFRSIMESPMTSEEKLRAMILMKVEGAHDISPEFLADFYNNSDIGLTTFLAERSREVWLEMRNDFSVAQQKGVFRKDLNLDFFFLFSQKAMEIAKDEAFIRLFPTPEGLVLEITNFFIYGIKNHPE
jgi:AcrR family transcriptional regulator